MQQEPDSGLLLGVLPPGPSPQVHGMGREPPSPQQAVSCKRKACSSGGAAASPNDTDPARGQILPLGSIKIQRGGLRAGGAGCLVSVLNAS